MEDRAITFSYAEPKSLLVEPQKWAQIERARSSLNTEPLSQRYAKHYADQMQLPAESLLRRDIIQPFTYEESIPNLQQDMAKHIKDFSAAAEQICDAIAQGKTIGISSDYDADGNTSLALFIRLLRSCGVPREKIIQHIPNRDHDGYGVNEAAVDDFVQQHVDLMITLDNGTRAEKPIRKALDAGMEVIVIDHHGDAGADGKTLPMGAKVVNANILVNKVATEKYPSLEESKSLAAVGMSYMMAAEIMQRMNRTRDENAKLDPKSLLGLVALGTVSDVVPMGWLNRLLVRQGLQFIHQGEDKNILRFMREAGINDPTKMNESDIAFRLGPIINAPGRLGDSVAWAFLSAAQNEPSRPELSEAIKQSVAALKQSADALKSDEQKQKEARIKAWRENNAGSPLKQSSIEQGKLYHDIPENSYLDTLIRHSVESNELRKDIEFLMRSDIRIEAKKQQDKVVRVIAGEGWHEGVIGIAASRVKEEFGVPSVVGSIKQKEDGSWLAKFSARCIRVPGYPVDIGEVFAALGPQHENDTSSILAKAGGHPMAAGASMVADTLEALQEKIQRFSDALNVRLGDDVAQAIAHQKERIFGTLNMQEIHLDTKAGQGSFTDRLTRLLKIMPVTQPHGEAFRAPTMAIRGVGIVTSKNGVSQSRRGHLNFDVVDSHSQLKIHCRASNAGGTKLAEIIEHLKSNLHDAIVVGQLGIDAHGEMQMEVEHVLPDMGLASDPAFKHSGVFGLVGLGREVSSRAA